MKRNKKDEAWVLRDDVAPYRTDSLPSESMVRTQIYLTRAEHRFLQEEATRLGEPMAAVIRRFIDEKMSVPEDAWINNPMLEPTPEDPEFEGHEDASLNHDHYAYGAPKQYEKRKGKWVLLPPVDE
jgi:hypothetical protein